MLITLANAPIGIPLAISRISGQGFAARIARLGLYEGTVLMRHNESVAICPIKARGPKGEVTLSGWLAAKVVIHLDDDRRIPLLECAHGDSGHVEGITGQEGVEESLAALGVVENDRITFLRRVPPMLYKAVVDEKERVQLNEGLASKLLGDTPNGPAQFCSIGVGETFTVQRILSGERARETLASLGISAGSRLSLTNVAAGQVLAFSHHKPIVCSTRDGLRLYFQEKDAARLFVCPNDLPDNQQPSA